MEKGNYNSGAIKLRIELMQLLKLAIKQADILNKILDDQHNMLIENAAKKAA